MQMRAYTEVVVHLKTNEVSLLSIIYIIGTCLNNIAKVTTVYAYKRAKISLDKCDFMHIKKKICFML